MVDANSLHPFSSFHFFIFSLLNNQLLSKLLLNFLLVLTKIGVICSKHCRSVNILFLFIRLITSHLSSNYVSDKSFQNSVDRTNKTNDSQEVLKALVLQVRACHTVNTFRIINF